MTTREYIKQRFQSNGVRLTDADLLDIALRGDIDLDSEMTAIDEVSIAIARFIPSLLLRASSVSEAGFSASWNAQGIKDYYAMLCKQYGLKDELNERATVTFI